jgi:hypothetical protein
VGVHLPLALICGAVLVLSAAFPLERLPLRACTFLHLTGYPCPFCGFTRAFWALGHGDFGYGLAICPLAVPAYGLLLLTFAWNAVPLAMGITLRRGSLLRLRRRQGRWAIVFIAVLFAMNWVYRLAMGLT